MRDTDNTQTALTSITQFPRRWPTFAICSGDNVSWCECETWHLKAHGCCCGTLFRARITERAATRVAEQPYNGSARVHQTKWRLSYRHNDQVRRSPSMWLHNTLLRWCNSRANRNYTATKYHFCRGTENTDPRWWSWLNPMCWQPHLAAAALLEQVCTAHRGALRLILLVISTVITQSALSFQSYYDIEKWCADRGTLWKHILDDILLCLSRFSDARSSRRFDDNIYIYVRSTSPRASVDPGADATLLYVHSPPMVQPSGTMWLLAFFCVSKSSLPLHFSSGFPMIDWSHPWYIDALPLCMLAVDTSIIICVSSTKQSYIYHCCGSADRPRRQVSRAQHHNTNVVRYVVVIWSGQNSSGQCRYHFFCLCSNSCHRGVIYKSIRNRSVSIYHICCIHIYYYLCLVHQAELHLSLLWICR